MSFSAADPADRADRADPARPARARLRWRWDELLEDQRAGGDPTGPWRAALASATARQYAQPVPPAMPAAFVLQWALEVPATVAAYAAVLTPWDPDLGASALSFDLSPQLFPDRVQLGTAHPATLSGEPRLAAARAAYEVLARPFATTYDPGVRLGPHQRLAMVDDAWTLALHRARAAHRGGVPSAPPPRRQACCFIYTLPSTHECAGCPRLSR